ncbi:MAG: hypothetical protein QXS02_03835 [Candidatus Thermoplasmatota archaeon]
MNNHGVYVHGATALAVSYPYMDVAVGYGRNTKRNPKRAARQCAEMIKKGLKDSKYKNKFILNLISSAEMPEMPILGRRKIIRSKLSLKILLKLFVFSLKIIPSFCIPTHKKESIYSL